jgi:hypothetical protein
LGVVAERLQFKLLTKEELLEEWTRAGLPPLDPIHPFLQSQRWLWNAETQTPIAADHLSDAEIERLTRG